ncbi:hypothetical protein D3C86_1786820 [compost metagenome]
MGNSNRVAETIAALLEEQSRDHKWLSDKTGINHKRVLNQIKHRQTRIYVDEAVAYAGAFGIELPQLVKLSGVLS